MGPRRRFLQAAGLPLVGLAGCQSIGSNETQSPTDGQTPAQTRTQDRATTEPSTPPGEPAEWEPVETVGFPGFAVRGVDPVDDRVVLTLSREDDDAALVALDPGTRAVDWRTAMAGEAAVQSLPGRGGRETWAVPDHGDALYAVAGRQDEYEWSAVHALGRERGERRFRFRRDRDLAVAGTTPELVVVTGEEFFEPEHTHDVPEEPLTTEVYGVDAATGEARWTRRLDGVEDTAVGRQRVYAVTTASDELVGFGLDGERVWRRSLPGAPDQVVAGDGRAYALAGDSGADTVVCVDAAGQRQWSHGGPFRELAPRDDGVFAGGRTVTALTPGGDVTWHERRGGYWFFRSLDGGTLYARSGRRADAAAAFDVETGSGWTFDPPSDNAWATAATGDAAMATAIQGASASEPFYRSYALDAEGRATASVGMDTVRDATGVDGAFLVATHDGAIGGTTDHDGDGLLAVFEP